jgi:hypothetical protein
MKIEISPDDIEMTLRIGGGELTLIDAEVGVTIEIILSESDMIYLQKRLSEWKPYEIQPD